MRTFKTTAEGMYPARAKHVPPTLNQIEDKGMKSYLMLIGDQDGLRDGNAKVERPPIVPVVGYRGFSGIKALPDQKFVNEMVVRRSALEVSAVQLSKLAGLSAGYISMVERGTRFPSEETKDRIRKTLDDLESGVLAKPEIKRRRPKNQPDPEFVKELIKRRHALRITGKELAGLAGLNQSYISFVETERTNPSENAKSRIREVLDMFEKQMLEDLTQDKETNE